MAVLALSRTCDLLDFSECLTVAAWQQRLAEAAWAQWTETQRALIEDGSLVVNYAEALFLAPGPAATYYTREPQIAWGVPAANGRTPPPTVYAGAPVAAVYGLGVVDRIDTPVGFLSQARLVLRPEGLLFLTFAYWDAEGPDTAIGAGERRRIYTAHSYQRLIRDARRAGFESFGGIDWAYHGNVVDDHSLASLVLTRRRGV